MFCRDARCASYIIQIVTRRAQLPKVKEQHTITNKNIQTNCAARKAKDRARRAKTEHMNEPQSVSYSFSELV